jgi:hypothetical protein
MFPLFTFIIANKIYALKTKNFVDFIQDVSYGNRDGLVVKGIAVGASRNKIVVADSLSNTLLVWSDGVSAAKKAPIVLDNASTISYFGGFYFTGTGSNTTVFGEDCK